jgi:hypothetical protein
MEGFEDQEEARRAKAAEKIQKKTTFVLKPSKQIDIFLIIS